MIVVGLGNPGKEYERTRHNAGWMFLGYFLESRMRGTWRTERQVRVAKWNEHYFVLPLQYMNNSGAAIADWLHYRHLDSPKTFQDLIVVHDDIDIPLGSFRVQTDRSSAGHRGVQSVHDALGSQQYLRIRIGIRPQADLVTRTPTDEFVLQSFSASELEGLEPVFKQLSLKLDEILVGRAARQKKEAPQ